MGLEIGRTSEKESGFRKAELRSEESDDEGEEGRATGGGEDGEGRTGRGDVEGCSTTKGGIVAEALMFEFCKEGDGVGAEGEGEEETTEERARLGFFGWDGASSSASYVTR